MTPPTLLTLSTLTTLLTLSTPMTLLTHSTLLTLSTPIDSVLSFLRFADLEPREAAHRDVFAHLRRGFCDQLRDLHSRIADRLLVDEHDLFEVRVQLALDDLVDDLRLLARLRELRTIDFLFLLEHGGRHLVAAYVPRVGR